MATADPDPHAKTQSPGARLDSWKSIAAHLNREVRTAQRWEKSEGLPVHRLHHNKRGSVYAYIHELDAWWESRKAALTGVAVEPEPGEPRPEPRKTEVAAAAARADAEETAAAPELERRWLAMGSGAALIAAVAALIWFTKPALKAVPIVNLPGDVDMASFSPDARSVAFRWDAARHQNGDIYALRLSSNSLRRLTYSADEDYSPAWSPDGRSIAFLRVSGQDTLLMLVPAEGGPERILRRMTGLGDLFSATLDWSADGKYIASPERIGDSVSLMLVAVATGQARRLTFTPAGQMDIQPNFSPDGRKLIFTRVVSASVQSMYLQPLTADLLPLGDSKAVPVFDNIRVGSPVWIGAEEVLFAANPRVGRGIWRLRIGPDGRSVGKPRLEPFAAPNQTLAHPSRDMRRLVFSQGLEVSSIWRVDLRTNPPRLSRLIGGGLNNASARVSPDGKRIVFESNRSGSAEVWMANADGTGLKQLTWNNGPVTGSPAWSPDGQFIAFDSRLDGYPYIYLMPAAGGAIRRLTSTPGANVLPSWSADGSAIYYSSGAPDHFDVWRIPLSGGTPRQITHQGGWAPAESPDGRYLYYQKPQKDGYSLHRLRWSDGEDREVVARAFERAFVPARDGVYFIPEPVPDRPYAIRFLGLDGHLEAIADIGRPHDRPLALSPDGSYLLFAQLDQWGHRLMLVDGLR
jgi:Tol biopolymer transport system component